MSVQFENVSKFYGDVLGVNRVSFNIEPGITSLVGPNGSGKTTLMNLMAGLLRPTRGQIKILGKTPIKDVAVAKLLGYCAQFDAFPKKVTGLEFITNFLRLHGHNYSQARQRARKAMTRVGLQGCGNQRISAYSKGMRQRIKLAQAIAHEPVVLILDEPLNGLDPLARTEMIALFKDLAKEGHFLIISSHILHEVDMISDQVILLNQGYVVAEGGISDIREEVTHQPALMSIRCEKPQLLASQLFGSEHVVEVSLHEDRGGLNVRTLSADLFYLFLNQVITETPVGMSDVRPADEAVHAVYDYLIENGVA